MSYPKLPDFRHLCRLIECHAQLKHEEGASGIQRAADQAGKTLAGLVKKLERLPVDKGLADREPSDLPGILALRPNGPRRMWQEFDEIAYRERLEGALLARMAGCTLGAPVESWPINRMENLARETGMAFPPTDYWERVPDPYEVRYDMSRREGYTRGGMNGVPVDDDIGYTQLGLLVVEDSGPDFTVADNGRAWLKYLPYACTAEDVALKNLKAKRPASRAGAMDNPYNQWIGADIRSDPWGYMAPGWPEFAADMAWRDAYLSHRRNGIYGEMFFSAAIAAAFVVKHPLEAIEIGLTEIPRACLLASAVKWALKRAPKIKDFRQARAAVDEKFAGMHSVHTINNACLTIWGLSIGGTDVTKVLGQTVAMGLDNDCTAATAGSIVGAVVGKRGVPKHWTRNFRNTSLSYLIGIPKFRIDDLINRFTKQAKRITEQAATGRKVRAKKRHS